MIIDAYINYHGAQWSSNLKSHAIVSEFFFSNHKIIACKPQTYMNLSGTSVRYLSQYYQVDPTDILVISDDLDLSSGKLRIRIGWSAGWHNGLKHIIAKLQTDQFRRCKYGIGRPDEWQDIVRYVLSKLSSDESQLLDKALNQIIQIIDTWISQPKVISYDLK